MSKPAKKPARRPAQRPKSTRRALAKSARTPARSAPVPKKEKPRRATTKNPAEFAAMMAQFDEIAGRASGSIEGIRASSDRRLKDLDRVFTDMRGMIAAVADENAKLRENADGVEARFELLIIETEEAIAASQRRDFSAEKLDPLADAVGTARTALDNFRTQRAAIYSPARAAEQQPEPAAIEQAAESAVAEEETPPVSAAAQILSSVHAPAEDGPDAVAAALADLKRENERGTLWQLEPGQVLRPLTLEPIRPQTARNSATSARPALLRRLHDVAMPRDGDGRTLKERLLGLSEFRWDDNGRMETRDGYEARIRYDGYTGAFTTAVRFLDAPDPVDIATESSWSLAEARRSAHRAIIRHRCATIGERATAHHKLALATAR